MHGDDERDHINGALPMQPLYTVFISPFIVLTQTGLTVAVLPGMPMNNIIGRVQHWLSGDR